MANPGPVGLWRLQRIHGVKTFKVVAFEGLKLGYAIGVVCYRGSIRFLARWT